MTKLVVGIKRNEIVHKYDRLLDTEDVKNKYDEIKNDFCSKHKKSTE